jgi:hypothetical protein
MLSVSINIFEQTKFKDEQNPKGIITDVADI